MHSISRNVQPRSNPGGTQQQARYTYVPELICVFVVIACSSLLAWQRGLFVHFNPINGAFQTFNPIRRLLAGQHVGQDFFPYLGLGPTLLTTWSTWLMGGHFAASLRASHWLSKLVFLWACWLGLSFGLQPLPRAARTRWRGLLLVGCWWLSLWGFGWSKELSTPSNSLLVLRASWILALGGWLRLTPPYHHHQGTWQQLGWCLLDGLWLACSCLWSNDYGLPCALSLLWCRALQATMPWRGWRALVPILLSVAASIPCLLGLLLWLTNGHLSAYLQAMAGVGADQSWYFEGKLWYHFSDVLLVPWLWLAVLVAAITWRWWQQELTASYLAWHGVTLASFGAGFLSCIAGHVQDRYFYPLALVCIWIGVHSLHRWLPTTLWAKWCLGWLPIFSLCLGEAGRYPPTSFQVMADMVATGLSSECGAHAFAIESLGGCLENRFRALQDTSFLREQSLWSTYAGFLESVHDSFQPTGIDYIIHALGSPTRQRYQQQLEALQPSWMSTIAPAYSFWEIWIRQKHWPIYQFLWQHYTYRGRIGHLDMWQWDSHKPAVQRFTQGCLVERLPLNRPTLRIWPQIAPPLAIATAFSGKPAPNFYGAVELTYESKAPPWYQTGAFRHGVQLCDHRLYPLQGCYRLPAKGQQHWSHPLSIDGAPLRAFDIQLEPDDSSITLLHCQTNWFLQADSEPLQQSSPQQNDPLLLQR